MKILTSYDQFEDFATFRFGSTIRSPKIGILYSRQWYNDQISKGHRKYPKKPIGDVGPNPSGISKYEQTNDDDEKIIKWLQVIWIFKFLTIAIPLLAFWVVWMVKWRITKREREICW